MSVPQIEITIRGEDGTIHLQRSVSPGDYVIGRASDCDLQVQLEDISRRHARLTLDWDQALIEDLRSSHGTFVDESPVRERQALGREQKIRLGRASVELRQLPATPPPKDLLPPTQGVLHRLLPMDAIRGRKYAVGEMVARGGMGAILGARDEVTARTVAMKVMLDSRDPDDLARFIAEAKITAQLEHPNIVPVHELSTDENGQPYYTMKMVRGITLKRVLEQISQGAQVTIRRHPLSTLLTIFQKVCDAVAFAHSKGIIHRDLKPANVMIGDYGEVLVMDWGLAKRLLKGEDVGPAEETASPRDPATIEIPSGEYQTLSGTVLGTPQFMAPEQARGEIEKLDERTDVYALGGILYAMLTLLPPVRGKSTPEILASVMRGEITPAGQVVVTNAPHPTSANGENAPAAPDVGIKQPGAAARMYLPGGRVPESLEAVAMKALALHPRDRYGSVTQLQGDVTAYQNGFATSAEKARPWKLFRLFIARHRAVSTAVAASLLIMAFISIAFTARLFNERNRAVQSEKRATDALAAAETDRARALASEKRATEALSSAEAERARTDAERSRVVQALADLQMARGVIGEKDEEIKRKTAETEAILLEAAAVDRNAAEERFAAGDKPAALAYLARACEAAPGSVVAAARAMASIELCGRRGAASAQFNADGKRILSVTSLGVAEIWDASNGGTLQTETGAGLSTVASARFSPDGRVVGCVCQDGSVCIFYAATGAPYTKLEGYAARVMGAEFSPDSGRVLTCAADQSVRLWDSRSGKSVATLPAVQGARSVQFSPNGNLVAIVCEDRVVRLWNPSNDSVIMITPMTPLPGKSGHVTSARFSPGSDRIAIAYNDGTCYVWRATTGTLLASFIRHTNEITSLDFSPDGLSIVSSSMDGTARVWNSATGRETAVLEGHKWGVNSAEFSPDGKLVVTASPDGTAKVWEAAGSLAATIAGHSQGVTRALFSPDGKRIVTVSNDGTARVWMLLPPEAGPPPDWFPNFVRWIANRRFDAKGLMSPLWPAEKESIKRKLQAALRAAGAQNTPYLELLRHYVDK
jgi:WD40 repeat protein/serine/threonine protein kinase